MSQGAGGRTTRRGLLGWAGAGAAATAAGAGGFVLGADSPAQAADSHPFHGRHQGGIVTPVQDRMHFASFDVTTDSREELVALLRAWTDAAEALTQGRAIGTATSYDAPPDDTGEATGLPPSRLTLTFGFGPGLFESDGEDRFGIRDRRPAALQPLPHFPGDTLDPRRSDGDLCVQACADDPQVAVHAIRNLARIGFGTVALRWAQLGFGRTSSTSTEQQTPRNLFGFKDGTASIKVQEQRALDRFVWVGEGDDAAAGWMAGGSYLVARRINMLIEPWDRTSLREQEAVIGRDRREGAPLSGGSEHAAPDFAMQGSDGPVIPANAHVRMAHPDLNDGVRLLRRGYNFVDGNDDLGRLDGGLFFIAFVRDPATHYVPMQNRLATGDGLSEYLRHTGSGLFAVPPGTRAGSYVGAGLFDA